MNKTKNLIIIELCKFISFIFQIIPEVDKYNINNYLQIMQKRIKKIQYNIYNSND